MSLYAMHRLCRNSQEYVSSFIGNNRTRSDAFSLAMACVLVNGLENGKKPSKPSPDTHASEAALNYNFVAKLGGLNEVFRLDVDKILGYAKKFYDYRADQLNWCGWVNVVYRGECAIPDFFGISKYFSSEDLKLIQCEGEVIMADIMKLNSLFNELGIFNE